MTMLLFMNDTENVDLILNGQKHWVEVPKHRGDNLPIVFADPFVLGSDIHERKMGSKEVLIRAVGKKLRSVAGLYNGVEFPEFVAGDDYSDGRAQEQAGALKGVTDNLKLQLLAGEEMVM